MKAGKPPFLPDNSRRQCVLKLGILYWDISIYQIIIKNCRILAVSLPNSTALCYYHQNIVPIVYFVLFLNIHVAHHQNKEYIKNMRSFVDKTKRDTEIPLLLHIDCNFHEGYLLLPSLHSHQCTWFQK